MSLVYLKSLVQFPAPTSQFTNPASWNLMYSSGCHRHQEHKECTDNTYKQNTHTFNKTEKVSKRKGTSHTYLSSFTPHRLHKASLGLTQYLEKDPSHWVPFLLENSQYYVKPKFYFRILKADFMALLKSNLLHYRHNSPSNSYGVSVCVCVSLSISLSHTHIQK